MNELNWLGTRDELQAQASGYLRAEGFEVLEEYPGLLVVEQQRVAGRRDTRLIWIAPPSTHVDDFQQLQHQLLQSFEEKVSQYPEARPNTLLAFSREGFTADFSKDRKRFSVDLRVPVEFFDAPFKVETAPRLHTAITAIQEPALGGKRVPQPFERLAGGEAGGPASGSDALPLLLGQISARDQSRLTVVVAPAGAGKSVLFSEAFTRSFDHFLNEKKGRRLARRPVPFSPAVLSSDRRPGLRVNDLFDEFIRSEMTARLDREAFKWLARFGYTTWLFDGFDELYSSDTTFFDEILDLLTERNGRANVLIFARDSLLTSPTGLGDFLRDVGDDDDAINVIKLSEWTAAEKRQYAAERLVGSGSKVAQRSPSVDGLLQSIGGNDVLKQISGIPFYMKLIVDEYQTSGAISNIKSPRQLLEHFVLSLLEREKGKEVFNESHFRSGQVRDWLEQIAALDYESRFAGVPVAEMRTYAEVILRDHLTESEQEDAVLSLLRFPFFGAGKEFGHLRFEHEIIAEYLAARNLGEKVATNPVGVATVLGERIDLADSTIGRELGELAATDEVVPELVEALRHVGLPGRTFGNLLQLILLADGSPSLMIDRKISVEGRNLSYVVFRGRDMRKVSFRGADLTGTVFENCDLRGAKFEGAHLIGTRFDTGSTERLAAGEFGALERFDHIFFGKQRLGDQLVARRRVAELTGIAGAPSGPCPAAVQLKGMFHKFVHFDGQLRRQALARRALLRGARVPEAPPTEELIDTAKRLGYLEGPDYRDRFERPGGDLYGEIVGFVSRGEVSTGIRHVLNAVCKAPGCTHVA